ncbi:Stf0 family sulfotransferase [Thioclava sp. CPCC 100088]|uniref:Stf0 family sulfotransferase n=2 Tax=Paracoccaceae TaxID=31989 RepID=A0ABV1SMJ7_9RHOB
MRARSYLQARRPAFRKDRLFDQLMRLPLTQQETLRTDLFDKVVVDPAKAARFRALPMPERRYVLFFTARSGSSRLGDILSRTGVLGQPNEAFNPGFVPNIAQAYHAADLADYAQAVLRRRNTQGTFGVEMTYSHMMNLFGSLEEMIAHLQPTSYLCLIRENLLAQALSLSKLKQTKVAHSTIADAERQSAADQAFRYNPREIMYAMAIYCLAEDRLEAKLHRHQIRPLYLSYEQTVSLPDAQILGAIAGHVGVELPELPHMPSSHHKLSGSRSAEYAARFAAEHPDFLARMEAHRAHRLDKLHGFTTTDA